MLNKKEREKKKEECKLERIMKAKKKLELEPKSSRPSCSNAKKAKRLKQDTSSESDCASSPKYMESDDSPYNESFYESAEDAEHFFDVKVPEINPMLEKYYAIFYDIYWYLGRVLDFPDEGQTKIKFLKLGLGDAYNWPKDDDIQVVSNKFILYGPIHLIGNGPFYIDDNCRQRIVMKYKRLKKNII